MPLIIWPKDENVIFHGPLANDFLNAEFSFLFLNLRDCLYLLWCIWCCSFYPLPFLISEKWVSKFLFDVGDVDVHLKLFSVISSLMPVFFCPFQPSIMSAHCSNTGLLHICCGLKIKKNTLVFKRSEVFNQMSRRSLFGFDRWSCVHSQLI